MKIIKYFVIFCISGIILSCAVQLYIPSSKDANRQQQLMEGRNLYIKSCSNCHNLHLPKEYNSIEWRNHLDDMQAKSKINDSQKELIYQYLISHP